MRKQSTLTPASLTTGVTQILAPNAHRTGIMFLAPGGAVANRYTLSPFPAAALDAGVNLSNLAAVPILLTYDQVGDIVQKAWYGIASVAMTIGIIEVIEVVEVD